MEHPCFGKTYLVGSLLSALVLALWAAGTPLLLVFMGVRMKHLHKTPRFKFMFGKFLRGVALFCAFFAVCSFYVQFGRRGLLSWFSLVGGSCIAEKVVIVFCGSFREWHHSPRFVCR
jgi:hypothetical protein